MVMHQRERTKKNLPVHTERVDVRDALVGQIVVAVDRKTQILCGHNHIVVLDDEVIVEFAGLALLDVAQ